MCDQTNCKINQPVFSIQSLEGACVRDKLVYIHSRSAMVLSVLKWWVILDTQ
jgi:hypothetical protein